MRPDSPMVTIFLRSAFFFLISYGMLYFSYKYYSHTIGKTSDFIAYYYMYLAPLEYDATESPYIYRQFSALITYFFLKIGVSYNIDISYVDTNIDQKVFFSALLSNYIALFFTANVVSRIVDIEVGKISILPPLLAGTLCYMSFGASNYVLTGLVEGWTWFLIALGFYAFRKINVYLFTTVLLIAIIQREIVIVIFGIMSFSFLLVTFVKDKHIDKRYLLMILISLLSFLIYIAIRKVLMPVDGCCDDQLEPSSLLTNLLESDYFSLALLKPNLLSQNLLYIYALFFFISTRSHEIKKLNNTYYILRIDYAFSIAASFISLYLIGMATGQGADANLGRVLLILSPIYAVYIAYYMYIIDKYNSYNTGNPTTMN